MANYDPRALLDPKSRVKEKAKKRPLHYDSLHDKSIKILRTMSSFSWRKRKHGATATQVQDTDTVGTGPQQSRKPTPIEQPSSGPSKSYDPQALLNPKAARAPQANTNGLSSTKNNEQKSLSSETDKGERVQGMSSYIERQYNLSNREAPPPPKKRKVDASEDGEQNEDAQKSTPTFSGAGSNGILGQHVKEEREKAAAAAGPASTTIDLTNDDDDDVQYLGTEVRDVCMGMLHAQANCHRIPRYPKSQQNVLGKNRYPQMRVNFKRVSGSTNVIDLYDRSTNGDRTGIKFGKVDVKTAAAMCPLIDGQDTNGLSIHIVLNDGEKRVGEFEGQVSSRVFGLRIVLYAPRNKADGIGKVLAHRQLFLVAPRGLQLRRDVDYFNPHEPKILGGKPQSSTKRANNGQPTYGVVRTQEEIIRETSSMFDTLVKANDIPEKEADQVAIKTQLEGLQKQALHFLTQHEQAGSDSDGGGSGIVLWKQRQTPKGTVWYNVISNHELSRRPEPVRGGILADVMGLGKTLSVLSLHAATREEAQSFGEEESPLEMENVKRNAKATLVICPKSVMTNWTEQMKDHTNRRYFKTYQYHGPNRTQDVDELAEYDIVLAPYGTVAAEFAYKNGGRNALASINWFRIVLDEGHSIRTPSTQVSRACCALTAQRRWAVTGTPVQNRLDDLGTLFKFLRVKPFDDETSWGKHIMAPLKTADENVTQHLQLLVASVTLRRTKDRVDLPKRSEQSVKLQFSAEERAMYAQFSGQANLQVKAMTREKGRIQGKGYAFMLRSIHRLRAICAHGEEMLSDDDRKELEGLTAATAIDLGDEPTGDPDSTFITETQAYDFLHMMVESESDICTGCGKKIIKKDEEEEASESSSDETDSDESDEEEKLDSEAEAKKQILGYINPCYDHLICPDCKDDYVQRAQAEQWADGYHTCPYCEQHIRFGLFELKLNSLRSFIDAKSNRGKKQHTKWDESSYSGPHTKVKALVNDLKHSAEETKKLPRGERPIKSVVFSGWTTYLDLIEYALDENGITYVRLDGSMSIKQRKKVLEDFKDEDGPTVILVSIKAGGQGLNLTSASRVYMMEPQFNPGVEQQAIDRVHRLGQKRDVEIKHFIMQDSIEEKIQEMQAKKQQLAQLAMEKKLSKGDAAKKRLEALKDLFK